LIFLCWRCWYWGLSLSSFHLHFFSSCLLDGCRCRKLGVGSGRRVVGRLVTRKVLKESRCRRLRKARDSNGPGIGYVQVSKKQQNRPCNNLQAIPSRAWTSRNWARCSREINYRIPFSSRSATAIVPLRRHPTSPFVAVGNPCRATELVLLMLEDLPHELSNPFFLSPLPCRRHAIACSPSCLSD
jgi:hypothetical protein